MQEVRQLPAIELSEDLAARAARRLGLCAYRLRRYREAITSLERFRHVPGSDDGAAEASISSGWPCSAMGGWGSGACLSPAGGP